MLTNTKLHEQFLTIWAYGAEVFGVTAAPPTFIINDAVRSTGNSNRVAISKRSIHHISATASFTEYSSFAGDPIIGSVDGKDDGITALLCHEISHALADHTIHDASSHGEAFQTIYRALRVKFVGVPDTSRQGEVLHHPKDGPFTLLGFRKGGRKYCWTIELRGQRLVASQSYIDQARAKSAAIDNDLKSLGLI